MLHCPVSRRAHQNRCCGLCAPTNVQAEILKIKKRPGEHIAFTCFSWGKSKSSSSLGDAAGGFRRGAAATPRAGWGRAHSLRSFWITNPKLFRRQWMCAATFFFFFSVSRWKHLLFTNKQVSFFFPSLFYKRRDFLSFSKAERYIPLHRQRGGLRRVTLQHSDFGSGFLFPLFSLFISTKVPTLHHIDIFRFSCLPAKPSGKSWGSARKRLVASCLVSAWLKWPRPQFINWKCCMNAGRSWR